MDALLTDPVAGAVLSSADDTGADVPQPLPTPPPALDWVLTIILIVAAWKISRRQDRLRWVGIPLWFLAVLGALGIATAALGP